MNATLPRNPSFLKHRVHFKRRKGFIRKLSLVKAPLFSLATKLCLGNNIFNNVRVVIIT